MDGGAWWAAVYRVAQSRTRLSNFTFTFHFHALEKAMATHSSVLAWRIPGMGEPGGLPSTGSHRVRHDWSDLAAAAAVLEWQALGKSRLAWWKDPETTGRSWDHRKTETEKSSHLSLPPHSVSSVTQSCLTLCEPMDYSMPGLTVHHQLMKLTQTHTHCVSDAIQPADPVVPFSSHLQSFPASGSFPMSQFFASGGHSIGVSASVLPRNIQDWFPLGLTSCISLHSNGLSRVSSNTTVQKHQFFGTQLSL